MRLVRPLAAAALWCVAAASQAQIDPDLLSGLRPRSIGPAGMSGRIASVDVVPDKPWIMYAGAATGGLWRSDDGGLRWRPLFDDQPVHSIGSVRLSPADHDLVWVGTGEGAPRNSVSMGAGVYKSQDGGESWDCMGLEATERIPKLIPHPTDPDTLYVAALGRMWGENKERGVYRTTDGGKTWTKVLYVDERTGCADLVMDPSNPRKLFAAMWDYRRQPHTFRSGGPGSGLYVTSDGGESWEEVTSDDGLPEGELGRIGLAIAPSNPDIVYAIVECEENGIWRSSDGGRSWENRTTEGAYGNRPFYYSQLRVDTQDPKRVYSLWSRVSVSDDGGRTWGVIANGIHPDHHALWINPNDPNHLIEGNDGGLAISHDRGRTWRFVSNLPLAQYYHIAVDEDLPYHVYGGMQDNGSWRGPNTVWENGGIRNHHWDEVGFGDGFATIPIPGDSLEGYAMSQEGFLSRWDLRTGERKSVRPWAPDGIELRFNWDAAIAIDPFDGDGVFYGSQFLHYSPDRGETWDLLSADLTTNNPEWQKQAESGGLTRDVTGAENFTTIVEIAPSRIDRGVVWVGTDDGRVWITQDRGESWASVESNIDGVPQNTWVSDIEACRFDGGTAYATFDDHRRSNFETYVMVTRDFGRTWSSLTSDAISGYAHAVIQDPVDEDLLFLGTEFGAYFSSDGGTHWTALRNGFPTCSAMGLAFQPRERDLVIGTHGRAAWVFDDLSPLRGLNAETLAKPLHLFPTADAHQLRIRQTGASRFPGATEFRGQVEARGAVITFSIMGDGVPYADADREADRPEGEGPDEVEITITRPDGETVRTWTEDVVRGINRVTWDLRGDAPEGAGFFRRGPDVLPGSYNVTVTFDGESAANEVRVLADPRVNIERADRESKAAMLARAAALSEAMQSVEARMSDLRQHANRVRELVRANTTDEDDEERTNALKAAREAADALDEALDAIDEFTDGPADQPQGITAGSQFGSIVSMFRRQAGSSWDAPNETERIRMRQAQDQVRELVARLDGVLAEAVPALKQAVDAADLTLLPAVEGVDFDG